MNRRAKGKGAALSAEHVRTQIEGGQVAPFYLLYGMEEYGREFFAHWLIEQLAPQQARDFNVDVFYGDRFDPLDFLHIYDSYPMMAERRLLVLRDGEGLNPDQCRALERVVDRPMDSSCLVLVGSKVDLRRKLFQHMGKMGAAVEFKPPYDREVPKWIQQQARSMGLKVEAGAVDVLRMYIGNNPRELVGEMEKLATYVGGKGIPITRQAAEEVVAASRSVNVFELADAVGSLNGRVALRLLNRYLDQGEEASRALAMIARHYGLLLRIKVHQERGAASDAMARALGVSPFFMNSYVEQANAYSAARLWRNMGMLRAADWQLRSLGRRQERNVMDQLMVKLCAQRKGSGA